jgi:hypothetical protein
MEIVFLPTVAVAALVSAYKQALTTPYWLRQETRNLYATI